MGSSPFMLYIIKTQRSQDVFARNMRAGRTFFGGAPSVCLEACPGGVAGVCGVPPPAAFSAPYRTEGPAGYLKANLLSEPQMDGVSHVSAFTGHAQPLCFRRGVPKWPAV